MSVAIDKIILYMKRRGMTYDQLGNKLGVTRGMVNNWLHGHRLPGKQHMRKLEQLAGIVNEWNR